MTNLELSNALAHDAKLVLSFIAQRKCRDPRDPLRSLITMYKKLYIGETGRRLDDRCRKHLRDMERNDKDAP